MSRKTRSGIVFNITVEQLILPDVCGIILGESEYSIIRFDRN